MEDLAITSRWPIEIDRIEAPLNDHLRKLGIMLGSLRGGLSSYAKSERMHVMENI